MLKLDNNNEKRDFLEHYLYTIAKYHTKTYNHNDLDIEFSVVENGNGNKCKNCAFDIPSYETIEAHFTSKDCQLCYTKEEFETYYINNSLKLRDLYQ